MVKIKREELKAHSAISKSSAARRGLEAFNYIHSHVSRERLPAWFDKLTMRDGVPSSLAVSSLRRASSGGAATETAVGEAGKELSIVSPEGGAAGTVMALRRR